MATISRYFGYKIHVYRRLRGWRALIFYPNGHVLHDVMPETDNVRGEEQLVREAKMIVQELRLQEHAFNQASA